MSSSSDGYHAHSRAASLAADPRSVLGSGAARSCQQPGLALALARGDYVETGERGGELAGGDPEGPRGGADLAQRGDRQQAARCKAPGGRPVEAAVPELVAEDDVDGWPGRQAVVEVDDVEPASIADPAPPGRSRAWPMATGETSNPQTSMPRRASHTAPSPCPQARSRACPAVGNMASKGANTGGGPTAATGAGPRLAYLLSQRTRSLSVTAVTLRSGGEMK